jgi:serine/threonine protein kinase
LEQLDELTVFHLTHEFTFPTQGQMIVSPLTGTAYTIGEPFASGGFSLVFGCTDEWNHDLVAKIVRPIGDIEQTGSKVVSEVVAAAIVRSPHIVHVYDTFCFKGAHYIISERCSFTLREIISWQNDPWPLFPTLAKAILHGLHFVHTQNIAHCDIHAGNVFLYRATDTIAPDQGAFIFKLGDFGQARHIEQMDPVGTFHQAIRPPEAMEVLKFGPIDHRSDIYQAGLLFLSFLHGEELRFNKKQVLSGAPRKQADALPSAVGPVISKMLRRHSEARQPTAIDVWRELQAVLKTQ